LTIEEIGLAKVKIINDNLEVEVSLGEKILDKAKDEDLKISIKSNYVYFKNAHCTFYRLAIVGMTHGDQPFLSEQKNSLTMVNGEIYNYKELQFMLNLENSPVLGSDCEIIHRLFEKGLTAIQICRILKGEWAFLHYSGDQVYFARDKLGRKPLYYLAESQQNSQNRPPNQPKILAVSSTIESLLSYKTSYNEIHECLPGEQNLYVFLGLYS
jgi:asparagine synthetase B (glutamine-hydrolysing)